MESTSNHIVELNVQLQRANERLRALYESAQTISSTLEVNEVLQRLVRSTAHVMGVEVCTTRLFDQTRARLKLVAAHGLSDDYLRKGLVLENDDMVRLALAGKSVNIGDATTDPRWPYHADAAAENLHSILIAPLVGKSEPLGLLLAASYSQDRFVEEDAEFLAAMGRQGGIAIENAMAFEALSKLEETKSKFVMTVTHELRSPVSTIRSLLRTMMAGYLGMLTDDQRDTIGRVLHRADFLQALIDDLLDLAAGKADLTHEQVIAVQLDQAVARVAKRLLVPAREKQIDLSWQSACPMDEVAIRATDDGIDRILYNLVSNAIKYTPLGGRVSVILSCVDGHAKIDVSDSGIGIPEEALKHVFEEFYRAPNAKAQVKEGTGLGLAIVKDLVTRYGGQISARSQADAGTTFTVLLPVANNSF